MVRINSLFCEGVLVNIDGGDNNKDRFHTNMSTNSKHDPVWSPFLMLCVVTYITKSIFKISSILKSQIHPKASCKCKYKQIPIFDIVMPGPVTYLLADSRYLGMFLKCPSAPKYSLTSYYLDRQYKKIGFVGLWVHDHIFFYKHCVILKQNLCFYGGNRVPMCGSKNTCRPTKCLNIPR